MKLTPRMKWIILGLLATVQFMVVLDVSIANVALPSIKQALGFSDTTLQWIVTAYSLTFGGMLLLGGRAADLFGRKRVFMIGVALFVASSLMIGLSQSQIEMIVFRGIQGAAAAFMSPSALSLVLTTFKGSKERSTALGVWSTVAAGGAALGMIIGGLLTTYLNWRWNFIINVPIGIIALIASSKLIPQDTSHDSTKKLDASGAVLITGGLMILVYALSEAPLWGWVAPQTISLLLLAVALIAGFIYNESKVVHPLMPLSIFKKGNVSAANIMILPVIAAMFSMFFLLSLYFERVMKFDPIQIGLAFFIFPVIVGVLSNVIPRFVTKIGFKKLLVTGGIFLSLGLFVLLQLSPTSNYFTEVLPALALMGAGMGFNFVSLTIAATSGVPSHESGIASGLFNTSQQVGGAIGVAVLSGIAASVSAAKAHLGTAAATVAGDKAAFTVALALALISLLIAVFFIKNFPTRRDDETDSISEPEVVLSH